MVFNYENSTRISFTKWQEDRHQAAVESQILADRHVYVIQAAVKTR